MFSAFSASSMPKRLLRHALSRLDLLDTDAIDVDNLDFAIGRNTVLEFRDVGLKLEKLERLLQLPPNLQVRQARVALLRISVPMNLYTSPISANVVGATVWLSLVNDASPAEPEPLADELVGLNAADLAQSFLEMQSMTEKRALEKALQNDRSSLSGEESDDDTDSESVAVGTGQPLSLPGFLTGFIQGVVDRVEISIGDVTFRFETEIPAQLNSNEKESASFVLKLDSIQVEGVTSAPPIPATSAGEETAATILASREGKRHVQLSKLRAYLVSDPRVFSIFSTSSPSGVPTNLIRDGSDLLAGPDVTLYHGEDFLTGSPAVSNHSMDRASTAEQNEPPTQQDEDPETPRQLATQISDSDSHASVSHLPPLSVHDGLDESTQDSIHSQGHLSEGGSIDLLLSDNEDNVEDQGLHSLASLPRSESSSENGDELLESRMFTHDEAESLYLSAASLNNLSSAEVTASGSSAYASEDISGPLANMNLGDLDPTGSHEPPPPVTLPEEDKENDPLEPIKSIHMPGGFGGWDSPVDNYTHATKHTPPIEEPPTPRLVPVVSEPSASQPDPSVRPPTPEGPIRTAKEILSLDSISIFLPSHPPTTPLGSENVDDGVDQSTGLATSSPPGAVSMYQTVESLADLDASRFAAQKPTPNAPQSIEVELSPIQVKFDVTLGFMLASMVSKFLEIFDTPGSTDASQKKSTATASSSTAADPTPSSVKVALQQISLLLVNNVRPFETPDSKIRAPSDYTSTRESDVLFRTDIRDITATSTIEGDKTQAKLSIGKVNMGYSQHPADDVMRFEYQAMLQASIRDAFPEKGADIEVSMTKSPAETRTTVLTLPLVLALDTTRLDNFLSRFDGIPGLAGMITTMYNHMPTRQPREQPTPRPKKATRGVRFDEGPPVDSGPKTDIRVGGVQVRIIGSSCKLELDTTSLKTSIRKHGIAVSCTKMQFMGPRTGPGHNAPITASIHASRIEFLNLPTDKDTTRLLDILLPEHSKFTSQNDFMIDTLLAQRRKGPVLKVKIQKIQTRVSNTSQLECLQDIGAELSKLAEIAKYLPEDDRPGILTLADIDDMSVAAELGGKLGTFHGSLKQVEAAHIGFPALVSVGVGSVYVDRNGSEVLVDSIRNIAVPNLPQTAGMAVRIQMLGDQPEPVVKIRVQDTAVEYHVPVLMDLMGLEPGTTAEEFETSLAASVANLGDVANANISMDGWSEPQLKKASEKVPLTIQLGLRDVLVGLNPLTSPAKMYAVIYESNLSSTVPEDGDFVANVEIGKAWLMLTNDSETLLLASEVKHGKDEHAESWVTSGLSQRGFAQVSYLSSAMITAKSHRLPDGDVRQMDVSMSDMMLILETCADSTQTLINLGGCVTPPSPPSTAMKYRTAREVQDLLASISGEAFGRAEGDYDFDNDFAHFENGESGDSDYDELSAVGSIANLQEEFDGAIEGSSTQRYRQHSTMRGEKLFDATSMTNSVVSDFGDRLPVENGDQDELPISLEDDDDESAQSGSDLMIDSNFFSGQDDVAEYVRLWDTSKGRYKLATKTLANKSPFRMTVRNARAFWHLFDGYDWDSTRTTISTAVKGVQTKAMERQQRLAAGDFEVDDESESDADSEVGDFLFNSIYISVAPNQDPHDITNAINRQIGDTGDTESVATYTTQNSNSTIRQNQSRRSTRSSFGQGQPRQQQLRLQRSRRHKISFDASGIDADIHVLPENSGPTQNCVNVRVKSLDIEDHLPQSSWNKFATYDRDHGERELHADQVQLELLNVKPVADLAATEFVVHAKVLPLRLHVDQDALDFLMRFFAFKEPTSTSAPSAPGDAPFVSRFEIEHIPVKLDFKPRRVDYTALRSGKTSELMNFVTLQEARIMLRRIMLHGISGFDTVGQMLNDLWTPDVTKTQLPTVLAGLSVVRPLADVGSGVRDLIEVPIAEYKKDGRIFRSIRKGALQFARNTGTNVIKLGAKVAVGTQTALENAEGLLTNTAPAQSHMDEPARIISPYANQPPTVIQGLRGGYTSLSRDVLLARDAIVAVGAQVLESEGAAGAARAVIKAAPTIIFRPAIGGAKAIGQTLLGAQNSLDPANKRRVEDKYKH